MKIQAKHWIIFTVLALVFGMFWYILEYPRFVIMDFPLNKYQAKQKAQEYLSSRGIQPKAYQSSVVFFTDDWADRYLQRALGQGTVEEFIKTHDFELFTWKIRFFKELQKEEYQIEISPKTGAVINFYHLIEDIEPREEISQEAAKQKAEDFLKATYGLDFNKYKFHEEKSKRYEKRLDYTFSWEEKGVYIPWQDDQGGAKLLVGATISGNEVRQFYKSRLDIPEKFERYIENQFVLGEYLYSFSYLSFTVLLGWAVVLIMRRKHTFAILTTRRWYIKIGIVFVLLHIVYLFNDLQNVLDHYPTSAKLSSFMGAYLIRMFVSLVFLSAAFILPGFCGESLRAEVLPEKKQTSFFYYLRSTFFSREVAKSIVFGYLVFIILLGIQAVLFFFGKQYFGVWKEQIKLTHLSSEYFPFIGAIVIGLRASLHEEIVFRLFAINLFKKYLKNISAAVFLSALIWGFGHTEYPIFPAWFRGIEVTIIGLFFGFIFLRYGLITVLVAHYAFDVFWGIAAYILGRSSLYMFSTSLAALLLPLFIAVIAFILNKSNEERAILEALNPEQKYTIKVLQAFIAAEKTEGKDIASIKQELLHYHWDVDLIDLAVKE